jgi:hypothetical protein
MGKMNISCRATLVIALLVSLSASAQDTSGLALQVEAVRFPSLARQARIQGDVRLRSGPDGVTVVSGHPLLTPTAVDSLKGMGKISEGIIEATYHFVFVDNTEIQVTTRIEKRGNRFERLILRALNKQTERIVEYRQRVEKPTPKNRFDLTGNRLEVWLYAAAPFVTVQTNQIARY